MALRPTKPKKKKNPFRLSSDRQPGIAKANKGTKKKGPRFGGVPNPFGPRQTPRVPQMKPYRPMPKKGIEEFLKRLEEKKKKGLEPTPAQTERLKRLKKNLLRQK